jgi:hypothetical protein
MMDLKKEAEEFRESLNFPPDGIVVHAFTSGANSKYVQAKIIQAQIDVLKSIGTIHDETCMSQRVTNKIKELQQQLNNLKNEI